MNRVYHTGIVEVKGQFPLKPQNFFWASFATARITFTCKYLSTGQCIYLYIIFII